jgi:hypothetical protein
MIGNEDTTGALFEVTGGWAAQTRWQRAGGHGFPQNKPLTPEDVLSKWSVITNFGTHDAISKRWLETNLFVCV